MPPLVAEATVVRNYLDWLLALPWSKETKVRLDIKKAEEILDEDHYGLQDVKDRILEYLAIRQLTQKMRGPILCFVGPPGVGKTSLAKSIARCLKESLSGCLWAGVRDEAEIRVTVALMRAPCRTYYSRNETSGNKKSCYFDG